MEKQLPFILVHNTPTAPTVPTVPTVPAAQAQAAPTTPLLPPTAPADEYDYLSIKTVPVKSYFFYLNNDWSEINDEFKKCIPNDMVHVNSVRSSINFWPLKIEDEWNWGVIYNWGIFIIPIGLFIHVFMLILVMQHILYTNNDLTEEEFEIRFSSLSRDSVNRSLYFCMGLLFILSFFISAMLYELYVIWRGGKWANIKSVIDSSHDEEYRGTYYKPNILITTMSEKAPLILLILGMGLMLMILCTTGRAISVKGQRAIFWTNFTITLFFIFQGGYLYYYRKKNKIRWWNLIFYGFMAVTLFTIMIVDSSYNVAKKSDTPTSSS